MTRTLLHLAVAALMGFGLVGSATATHGVDCWDADDLAADAFAWQHASQETADYYVLYPVMHLGVTYVYYVVGFVPPALDEYAGEGPDEPSDFAGVDVLQWALVKQSRAVPCSGNATVDDVKELFPPFPPFPGLP